MWITINICINCIVIPTSLPHTNSVYFHASNPFFTDTTPHLLLLSRHGVPYCEMAPLKQSLLSLSTFVKDPSKATIKKHKKLTTKIDNEPKKFKPRVDHKAIQRIAEEKDIARGAAMWRYFLQEIGVEDVDGYRCDILYQSNGEAPDPHAFIEEEEDGFAEFKTRWNRFRV